MGFLKKTKIVEKSKVDVEEDNTKVNVSTVKEDKKETKKEKEVKLRKGIKVIVTGRLYGSSDLTAPMGTVYNYEGKILDLTENAIMLDEGWISKESIQK